MLVKISKQLTAVSQEPFRDAPKPPKQPAPPPMKARSKNGGPAASGERRCQNLGELVHSTLWWNAAALNLKSLVLLKSGFLGLFQATMRFLCLLLPVAFALPGDEEIRDRLQSFQQGKNDFPCKVKECQKPTRKFERISNTQAGYQWGDAGGYCGSWSIQRAVMAKGAWISQQQVRNHTVPGGGHDEEILATNIDVALQNLKIAAEGFDYKHLPVPQVDAYRKWIKKQLVNGHTLAPQWWYEKNIIKG